MTTAGNDTASTREDKLLARVYQQVIGAQGAQYAAAWDAGAGLARFRDWLQDHAVAGLEPGADQMAAQPHSTPEPDPDQAAADLYALHYRPLVRLAALLVRDAATAEEVVQNAFAAMHAGWPRLGDPEMALAYLRQAVVNRSRSVLRHRTATGGNPPQPPPGTPGVGHEEPGLLEQPGARAALLGLPERQREAIVLRYYAGLSEGEIAAAMGISRGAVNSHTARGMSALRVALDQASPQPARPRDSDDAGSSHEEPQVPG
jgi:RNA polymerase sigma-70 factor (sigma-E family)